ncbi:MAG: hypothetical protein JSU95_10680 [Betaproteobacteria bacterium]|nr:MAG: hypothetical protein JSU95_10680 [Betaproteobacteria bacterium]
MKLIASSYRKSFARSWILHPATAMAFIAMIGHVMDANTAEQGGNEHGGRLSHVQRLIEESSAAKSVEASGNEQAKARREEARSAHQQALAAHAEGNHKRADELLAQAMRLMFEAVQLAESNVDVSRKKAREFDARVESVDALTAAFERICDEKKCDPSARKQVIQNVREKAAQADRLRESGDLDAARIRLDEAYVAIKIAVEHQRSGDTLVRSLSFANKEEEYHYELDRNDTHQMLIKLLLEEGGRSKAANLKQFLQEAQALRNQAEKEAASGKFDAAVRSLENSTSQLMQALRRAGIYIPG